ncbi:MAG: hypothetical protein PHO56_00785 [Patescibacteria group bacterium]|nr:hypothetical protein [Patescibacteria group bacterium]
MVKEAENNQKINPTAKKKIIDALNKLLDKNSEAKQKAIVLNLDFILKTLDKIKEKNGINQAGYDMIKADINYLLSNL